MVFPADLNSSHACTTRRAMASRPQSSHVLTRYACFTTKIASKAKELRQKLDELNLKAEGTHIATRHAPRGDALKRTIEFNQILGTRFLIVPSDGDFSNPKKSKAFAETFNQAAEVLKPLGMYAVTIITPRASCPHPGRPGQD